MTDNLIAKIAGLVEKAKGRRTRDQVELSIAMETAWPALAAENERLKAEVASLNNMVDCEIRNSQFVEAERDALKADLAHARKEVVANDRLATAYMAELTTLRAENDALKAENERLKAESDPELLTIAWMDGAHDAKRLARENTTLRAERDALKAEVERLREALANKSETNDEGLLPCPECYSTSGPHLYWWTRGQAWLVICGDCKHEANAREEHEYRARDIWNEEARATLTKLKGSTDD